MFVDPTMDTISVNPTEPMATESITTDPITSNSKPTDEPTIANGVLGIYRITLWIIVLSLTVLTTSLTSGLLL